MSRQKTYINGKRGDKRNSKAPKSKYDSFSVKSGLASFSSAAVGNNILGMTQLSSAVHHICSLFFHQGWQFWVTSQVRVN